MELSSNDSGREAVGECVSSRPSTWVSIGIALAASLPSFAPPAGPAERFGIELAACEAATATAVPDKCRLFGKIQVVEHFPDVKIQIVQHFPDLKVKIVEHFPDRPGKWQMVTHFPDYKNPVRRALPRLQGEVRGALPRLRVIGRLSSPGENGVSRLRPEPPRGRDEAGRSESVPTAPEG